MAQRLGAGLYARPYDLAADVMRVLQGGAAHPEGSELHAAAKQAQAVFEALWQQLMSPYSNF